MKRQFLLMALFAIAILKLSGCNSLDLFDCEKVSSEIVTQTYDLAAFDELNVYIDADVYLSKGTEYKARLEGPINVVNTVEMGIRNKRWDIELSKGRCLRSQTNLKVYITIPSIESINLAGSGNIELLDTFEVNNMSLKLSGSGNLRASIVAEQLFSVISGSGDILLEGEAINHDTQINGSGNLKAFNLSSETADISMSGSGNSYVSVNSFLDAGISGSGNVYYRGNPEVSASTSGSGKVVNDN